MIDIGPRTSKAAAGLLKKAKEAAEDAKELPPPKL